MAQMNISVPDGLKAWADARVAQGRYSSTSDYVRDLMRRDQDRAASDVAWVQAKLDEGTASEVLDEDPRDVIRALRVELTDHREAA
jgi:antitoxin ParD1/3/4